jgi:hypothetical protein
VFIKNSVTCALAISAMLGATGVAADTSAFDGIYKPRGSNFESWDCKTIGQDGGAVAIDGNVLRGVETYCKLNNPVNVNGMSAVLFDAECAGEGYEWAERVMFMTADFGIYYITDKFVAEWQSCAVQ